MSAVIQPGRRIRPMQPQDLVGVIGVERESYDYPWSRRIFEDCMQVGYCCLVAEDEGCIQGHGIMLARAGEAHVLNLCVAPAHRRCGIAGELLENLLQLAGAIGAETAFLEVRPSNVGAIALYEHHGFHEVGRRPDYYPSPFGREEAVVMARELIRD
ncbi:MAG: ribosomal protein S18-alanine N-acetyltransferase [Halofilum sp. (in: g-proteobacteria)]|nr:ribosomal protein S18-alanine N-acetyltransferase [Halofilum sp. (in: g-proteobacteria)]